MPGLTKCLGGRLEIGFWLKATDMAMIMVKVRARKNVRTFILGQVL